VLRILGDVRPQEMRVASGAFLTLFGILAAHTLLETARDALFLARLPATQLPWMYLAIAAVAFAASQGPWSALGQLSGRYGLSLLLLVSAVATGGFWLLGSWRDPWTLRLLYVWTGVVGTLASLQFWLVLGELFTVTEAKRVYRVVGLGSLLGAVVGSGLARLITAVADPQHLVIASAVALAVTALGPAVLLQAAQAAATPPVRVASLAEAVRSFRDHPYVRGLAGLVLMSTVALTLADYVFKSAVARAVDPAHLASFFATFYMVLNLCALAAQVALLGWALRVLGLHRALWVLPILIAVGSAGFAAGGGLAAAILLKGADGTLRQSLHRTGIEMLSVPIPDVLRSRTKPLIDVVGQRGGQALASVLILSTMGLARTEGWLAVTTACLGILWIALASDLKRHYVELFRSALREGAMRERADLPTLDLASLEVLITALNSQDDAEVVAAMDLLVEQNRERLIPGLILYHPSRAVLLRALEIFAKSERTDFVPLADLLLEHPDPDVRATALRARIAVAPDEGVLRKAAKDPSLQVRATSLAGLVSGGWIADEAQATLDGLLSSGSSEARAAVARAIRQQPAPVFEDVLLQLAESPEEEVQIATAEAMAAVGSERFLPALLHMLAAHEVRSAARAALLAIGPAALDFLEEALADDSLPHELRRHLPRTISLFRPANAAAVLLRRLLPENDGMVRFKILRGLGRIAADHPEVTLDRGVLDQALARTLAAAFRLVHWKLVIHEGAVADPRRATPGHELLATLLHDKERHAVERIFRLMGLRYRREDFRQIYRGLHNANPKVRAGSRELLENLLEPPLRKAVLALIDDAPDRQRLADAAPYYAAAAAAIDYEALLTILLEQGGESLRCIAAYHVGELGLQSFRDRLQRLQTDATFFVARAIERALSLLAAPEGRTALAG
jgi:AAA family ATP:ADP antiporter